MPINCAIRHPPSAMSCSDTQAVVMAGGQGMRLRPLTLTTPKPMLHVHGRPILDHVLDGLQRAGLHRIVITVNYLAEQIQTHVQDGQEHGLSVSYIHERERLGTAGSLALLNPRPTKPFLVINADLLTNYNFAHILAFHARGRYALTVGVSRQDIAIPYGVLDLVGHTVARIREKPVESFQCNTGIYVLQPSCIDHLPQGQPMDMPSLIQILLAAGQPIGACPISAPWSDIGTASDLSASSSLNPMPGTVRPALVPGQPSSLPPVTHGS